MEGDVKGLQCMATGTTQILPVSFDAIFPPVIP